MATTKYSKVERDDDIEMAASLTKMAAKKSKEVSFQVVAPCDMKGNFRFAVQSDGQVYAVSVPDHGVSESEVFTPEMDDDTDIENVDTTIYYPPAGKWKDGLCDCFTGSSSGRNLMGWFCQGPLLGEVQETLQVGVCGRSALCGRASRARMWFWYPFWIVFLIMYYADDENIHMVYGLMAWCFIIMATLTRVRMRRTYGIPGNGCIDCLSIAFCTCCSLTQMGRHVDKEEVPVSGFAGVGHDVNGKSETSVTMGSLEVLSSQTDRRKTTTPSQ